MHVMTSWTTLAGDLNRGEQNVAVWCREVVQWFAAEHGEVVVLGDCGRLDGRAAAGCQLLLVRVRQQCKHGLMLVSIIKGPEKEEEGCWLRLGGRQGDRSGVRCGQALCLPATRHGFAFTHPMT